MADYECSKCGLTGWSKNPHTRSLFTNDTISSMMCAIASVTTKKNDEGNRVVTFEFPRLDFDDRKEWPNDKLEMKAAKLIRGLTEEQLEHWLCSHKWEHTEGKVLESNW